MRKQIKKAKLTLHENGTIVVEPYAQSNAPRYTPLLELDYGSLTCTQQHYRLLLMLPKRDGLLATIRHLSNELDHVRQFLTNLLWEGGVRA